MEFRDYTEEIDFQKYWLVLKRRWMLATGVFGAVLILTSLVLLQQKPVYEAEGRLLFNKTNRSSSLTGLGADLGQLEALGSQDSPLDTQAEIVRSTPLVQEAIRALNLRDEEGEVMKPEALAEQLNVRGIPGTDVLQISYQSADPEVAARVVNKLIEVFIRNNIQSNRAEAAAAREFIVQQLPSTETAVREADSALREFREENRIIALDQEASAAVSIISNLEDQIAESQAELADVSARSQELQNRLSLNPEQAYEFAALSQAPGVQTVLTELQTVQTQLAVERSRYQSGHPTIANLERRVESLNALLQDRIVQVVGNSPSISIETLQAGDLQADLISELVSSESSRLGLLQRITALTRSQAAYRERANVLPRLEQYQRELERQLQAAQTTYETLLTRLQEIQVAENQTVGNARILSPALVPNVAVGPRKMLFLGMGTMAGLFLAVATAFLLDLVDRSVKSLKEARSLFGYTLLAVVPQFQDRPGRSRLRGGLEQPVPRVLVRDQPRSSVAEAYQMLQANLKFLQSEPPLRTMVITSSVAYEGKSEVAANLAAAIAQVGSRVLLVDADFRCPAQHHVWDLVNTTGLSNVIVEQVSAQSAAREVMPNLYVLPAGVIPPNPIALLDSKRMAALVATFSKEYDFVIFDTPSLAGKADAAVLGKLADGVLLVVRPGVVDSSSANAAKEFLRQSGQNVLGMVINGIDVRSEPDSYFYYTGDRSQSDWIVNGFQDTSALTQSNRR